MYGLGILKGMWVTLTHFIDTYVEDIKWLGRKRYFSEEGVQSRRSTETKGIFTVQYPEEKLPVPEEFRFTPFLVYDVDEEGNKHDRCTSCGICAKVCPPQCIWIVRTEDPVTKRPVPEPVDFFVDVDICMNCGYCAEYCPFDAIKMDHNYEMASYDRHAEHIFNKEKLSKPAEYYASIRPTNYAREEAIKAEEAAKKAAAAAAKAAAATAAPAASSPPPAAPTAG
ncbi:MAG: 4Fe-4S binding protein [Anaerolineales bacterium]|jgi:NADH-quinone oxidoreductase subunit I|nr:4Fe-4S binding protein [Anaerolineales bacterium]MBX3004730.1 4Fe-4S binding protein [Anaerolineales bacterium]MCW5838423.1 4Fe-4S binding protein [Anaerolineales bacterium]MCW5886954.1 4Fe-4S binding protein [Anaerolineales bacterium]